MLHTVNKSPFQEDALMMCFGFVQPGNDILLIEDGVYGALANAKFSAAVETAQGACRIYALEPDLKARGIGTDRLISRIELVDYDGFVKLVAANPVVQAW